MKKKKLLIIGSAGFLIILFLLLILNRFNKINSSRSIKYESKKLTYQIIDSKNSCDEKKNLIFEDKEYKYYLPCSKKEEIIIKFSNGDEYTLKEILDKNIISLDDLVKKGLNVEKEAVFNNQNSTFSPSSSNTNEEKEIKEDDKLILNIKEIQNYNKGIKRKADMVYDLDTIKELSKTEVLNYIMAYEMPNLPKYNGNDELTLENTQEILANRNLDDISDVTKVINGIIVERANLRSFPTNIHFYDSQNVMDFDRLQETELHVNTPVIILHESKDHEWNFVISPFYAGWVLKKSIAYATDDDISFFTNNANFGIIIEPLVRVGDVDLDMSVKLPYVGENSTEYQLIIPGKDAKGNVVRKDISILKKYLSIGYLPYTKNNVYKQAQKYLGHNYSWGGMDNGVDCSSFISNVYRTFGFYFPRNTSSQNKSVGNVTNLAELTPREKLQVIKNTNPSLLFQNGHVMLYLGTDNDKHLIIHASGSEMKVVITELSLNSNYLKNINKLVTIY